MIFALNRFVGWRKTPSLAFAGTVALAYLCSFWEGAIHLTDAEGAWCLVFGVSYAALGMIDFTLLCRRANGFARALYLCIQAGLLFGIFWTGRLSGETPLCVYPLVAATVTLLGPVAATLGVALLYGATLAIEGHFHGMGALLRWSISMLPGFGFVVIFTLIALKERAARNRAESLTTEIEKLAVIQERNRLAREIHDSLGHFLTTIHVQLQAAQAIHSADPARALEAVAKARGLAHDALAEVRRAP